MTQYRYVVTLHFVLDLESVMTELSMVFQSEDATPSAVQQQIEETYSRVELLKTIDGISLQDFRSKYDPEFDSYEGINLEECQSGEEMFQLDRIEVLT